jgi:hypothetical protein
MDQAVALCGITHDLHAQASPSAPCAAPLLRSPPPHPNSVILAAACVLALVAAVSAQQAGGIQSQAAEYLVAAQELATKYGSQATEVAKVGRRWWNLGPARELLAA